MAKEMNRLQAYYKETVVPAMMKEFGYKNQLECPKVEKIVVNRGLGDVKDNSAAFNKAVNDKMGGTD